MIAIGAHVADVFERVGIQQYEVASRRFGMKSKAEPISPSAVHDNGVARFQWPVDRLARSRRGLNPLHARAAR